MANDIEIRAKTLVTFMNSAYKKQLKAAQKKVAAGEEDPFYTDYPTVTFSLNRGSEQGLQTPEHKAVGIVAKRSSSCQSAHLVDKARHINTKFNGDTVNHAKKQVPAFGDYHDEYKKIWKKGLDHAELHNHANGKTWSKGDAPHVELPNSKIKSIFDPLVLQCVAHYAKLTQEQGKPRNEKFEKSLEKKVKKHLDKLIKDFKKKSKKR